MIMEKHLKKRLSPAALLPENRKRFFCLLGTAVLLLGAMYRLYHPADPLADLKKLETTAMDPAAQKVIDKALERIADEDMKGLYALMRVKDTQAFQANYTEGIFEKKRGAFAPASVVGRPKRLVKSSWENLFVRLRSEPRREDYWISLVRIGDEFLVSEIVPVSACGGLK